MITAKVINEGDVVYVHFSNGASYCLRANKRSGDEKLVRLEAVHSMIMEMWLHFSPDEGHSVPIDMVLSHLLSLPVEVNHFKPEKKVWRKIGNSRYECPVCHTTVCSQHEGDEPYEKCPICGSENGVDNG